MFQLRTTFLRCANFDYALGHIHEIADMPYEQFLEYAHHPMDWTQVVHRYVEVHHFVDVNHHFDDLPTMDQHQHYPSVPDLMGGHQIPAMDSQDLDGHYGQQDYTHQPAGADWTHDGGSFSDNATMHNDLAANDLTQPSDVSFADHYDDLPLDYLPGDPTLNGS